jgi:MFS family permease
MTSSTVPTRRVYLLLCGSLAAQSLGQTAVFAVLPSIGREVGLLEIQVGAIIAASSVVFFFAGPLWGRASDRIGRRKVFLIGQFGYVIGGSLFAASFWAALEGLLLPLYAWFGMIAARMMQATLMSASQPAAGAFVADITGPQDRAKGLARIGAANNLGSIVGPAVGGLLATLSLFAPFVLAVISVGVGAVLSCFLLPTAPRQPAASVRPRVRFTDRRLLPWVTPGILMFLGAAVVQQTLSFRIQDALSLDAAAAAGAFGATMMASAVAGLIAQALIVQRFRASPGGRLGRRPPAGAGPLPRHARTAVRGHGRSGVGCGRADSVPVAQAETAAPPVAGRTAVLASLVPASGWGATVCEVRSCSTAFQPSGTPSTVIRCISRR